MFINITIYDKKIFFKRNMLEITDEYLLDYTSTISLGKIALEDIDDVFYKRMYIVVCLKENVRNKYLSRTNWLKRIFIKCNIILKYGEICLSITTLGKDSDDVYYYLLKNVIKHQKESN